MHAEAVEAVAPRHVGVVALGGEATPLRLPTAAAQFQQESRAICALLGSMTTVHVRIRGANESVISIILSSNKYEYV